MTRLCAGEVADALAPVWAFRNDRVRIERLRRVLLDGSSTTIALADEIRQLLRDHPDGLSASEITSRSRRRGASVRAALNADSRFVRSGDGRGTRWRLATAETDAFGRGQERLGGDANANASDTAYGSLSAGERL